MIWRTFGERLVFSASPRNCDKKFLPGRTNTDPRRPMFSRRFANPPFCWVRNWRAATPDDIGASPQRAPPMALGGYRGVWRRGMDLDPAPIFPAFEGPPNLFGRPSFEKTEWRSPGVAPQLRQKEPSGESAHHPLGTIGGTSILSSCHFFTLSR
jgi:hypothetical protein